LENDLKKRRVAALSVASNTTLVVLKIIVGLAIGSISVISEAIHSGVDLLAAFIALGAVIHSGRPADREHPYGHGKIENISGVVEALLIFLAAGWIIFEAIKKLLHPMPLDATTWGIVVMAGSAFMNIMVSRALFKVGKETESIALQADAWHLRTDVWTSFGVMSGLAIIMVGRLLFPGINIDWLDPVAACTVALLIVKAAWELTVQSFHDLMDESLPPKEVETVLEVINSMCPDLHGYHALKTRKSGSNRFVEVHVLVDPEMSVEHSHALTDKITDRIRGRLKGTRVMVHVEPDDGSRAHNDPKPSK
jgi:cation diffusion facilitator family transporter